MSPSPSFARYVALGDSTTEGLDDPDGDGGYRGWADRLAHHLGRSAPLAYANLAVRGKLTREIRETQLDAALAMRPDLATVVAGMNDLLRARFDAREVAADVATMQRALRATGCTVITVTIPDLSHRLAIGPFSRLLSRRTLELDDELRRVTRETGALLVDLARHDLARDPRLWSRDRLHLNSEGHARAAAAMAYALDLPGSDLRWLDPLPDEPPPTLRARVAEQLAWGREYFAPWLVRRLRNHENVAVAKRPTLQPI